jgi:hypothetical protein
MNKLHLDISVLADAFIIVVIVPRLRNFAFAMYNTLSYVPFRGRHQCFDRLLANTKDNGTTSCCSYFQVPIPINITKLGVFLNTGQDAPLLRLSGISHFTFTIYCLLAVLLEN